MIGVLCMSWSMTCFAIYTFRRLNKEKEEKCKVEGIDQSQKMKFVNDGDDSPLFRFSV